MKLNIKDHFNTELPADKIKENNSRQVTKACFSFVSPKTPSNPKLVHSSEEMLTHLGLEKEDAESVAFLNVVSGKELISDTHPYAMCYGGHQFGNWAGQLGDGRAINLAEISHNDKTWALQLKGAGETPYSRNADGLAVLRSSIREYLCSEAMHHLGIPTTRALSLSLSGDEVLRDPLYNGNSAYEKGAIVARVAPSFLRFGSYELPASRQDKETLQTIVDYTIKHHFKHLGIPSKENYIAFFKEVTQRSMDMVIHWQRVGFVHGVMNTDNMSILGLTIDYGPYGWLEDYDPTWTPNTTDASNRRYRYGTQPQIVLWNLLKLANALYPLIEDSDALEEVLLNYHDNVDIVYNKMMHSKLGLSENISGDSSFVKELEKVLQLQETDMTIFFRNLANLKKEDISNWFDTIEEAFYDKEKLSNEDRSQWRTWFDSYAELLKKDGKDDATRKIEMNKINPKYVLRNYMAQLAIEGADDGDYSLLNELFQLLKKPYSEQPEYQKWFAKRPDWARHKVGCSMLSCSS